MKIVIDTNVLISGIFFGGFPKQVIQSIVGTDIKAYATPEIINEYDEVINEMIARKQGKLNNAILSYLLNYITVIEPVSKIEICRDKDDNKFLECAKDAKALYIVSGDKDLLSLGEYEDFKIITAKGFCEQYLKLNN